MPDTKKFLIIDGNALVHRAFHALPPLKTRSGEIINAVYGFFLVFFKALKDIRPNYAAATFDLAAPTFRHKQFKEYKAKRVKAPDELYQQLPIVKEILTAFGVPIFEKEGFEADDVIGTLACRAQKDVEVVILSGDMDNLQLVNDRIKVYTLRKGIKDTVLYDIEEVKRKYDGLLPEQLLDYRGLRGDPSDNIPGVGGIGEKTAIELLKDFSGLDDLYKEIDESTDKASRIRPSVLQKLKDGKEQAFFSRQLAGIERNVPIDFDLTSCRLGAFDLPRARDVLAKFEFNALIKRLPELISHDKNDKAKDGPVSGQAGLFGATENKAADVSSEINRLEKQGVLSPRIARVERDIVDLVKKMEQNGIRVDIVKLNDLSRKLAGDISRLQKKIYKVSGCEFNINSPRQVAEILFDKLGLSPLGMRKTPGGVISTGADELKKIKDTHPVVAFILSHRELSKLKSGFTDSLATMIDPKDGRIHPHFHQLGTETGRMSCSDPNLQNIPVKTALGKKIRGCFVPENGFVFLSADYSQMDFRAAASLSGDEKMLGFLEQGKDIHLMTASLLFGIKEKDVSEKQRRLAKTLNYGVLYGLGPLGFANRTGIPFKEAKQFISQYFETFQGIARFVEKTIAQAREEGFSLTMFGRKRFLPEIDSMDPRIKAQAERIARNFPVQGTSADIMKIAMAGIASKRILNKNCRLLLQLHDELLFEVKEDEAKKMEKIIMKTMESAADLAVPLKVETKIGLDWGEC
ncbi:MAG: DNA polymerase [Candidatus Pacebacteria bacterium]|nr:DNA polymerase [Candidatus Paceibacterota bacterium]